MQGWEQILSVHSVFLAQSEKIYIHTQTHICKYVDAFAYWQHLLSRTDGGTGSKGLLHSATSNTSIFSRPDPCSLYPGTSNKRRIELFFKPQQVREE